MTSWGFAEGDELVPGRQVVSQLGDGLRYETYLAWDSHLRALVVVKIVRPELVDDEGALRGLRAETRLLGRLAHPNLLRSFGAQLDGERPHLVLEFIEGPRLSTLIRRFGVILEQLLPLALNLCAVLHYLERERVVHLDVKPSNVIMAGGPRLIDLSIARTFDELPELRSPVGTDAYMAPEQCDPARFADIGPASDIWGLGATLYEAVGRVKPFPADENRFPQLHTAPLPLSGDVPPALAAVVMSCLSHQPHDRPRAGDLADALEPMVDALPAPKIGRFRPGGGEMLRSLGTG